MKKILLSLALWTAYITHAQTVPQAFNYQGIARDAQGVSLGSKTLGIKITLQEKSGTTTTDVYAETHTVTTNAFGLFNIAIGKGTPSLGLFSSVQFANKNIVVKTDIDSNGGSNYTLSGSSELLSVPYALVAGNTEASSTNYWQKTASSNVLYVNNGEKIAIGTSTPTARLHVEANASGEDRELGRFVNTNPNNDCSTSLNVLAGSAGFTITQHAPQYTLTPGFAGSTIVGNNTSGLILNASSASGYVSIFSGGVGFANERIRVAPDGKIGIGTSTPTATLDLVGTARLRSLAASTVNTQLLTSDASGNLAFRDLSTISSLSSPWLKNTTTNTVTVSNGEKVGIGTATPQWPLHLSQAASGGARNMVMVNNTNNGNDATVGITLKVGAATDEILALGYNGPNYSLLPNVQSRASLLSKNIDLKAQSSTGSIKFYTGGDMLSNTSGQERMMITANGKVAIGTSAPTAQLHVEANASGTDRELGRFINTNPNNDCSTSLNVLAGSAGFTITQHAPQYTLTPGFAGSTIVGNNTSGLILNASHTSGYVSIFSGGVGFANERVRVTPDGNIGIGTATPKSKLQVSQGDMYIDDPTKGVIMTSPNGQCWRLTVNNTGVLATTSIPCP